VVVTSCPPPYTGPQGTQGRTASGTAGTPARQDRSTQADGGGNRKRHPEDMAARIHLVVVACTRKRTKITSGLALQQMPSILPLATGTQLELLQPGIHPPSCGASVTPFGLRTHQSGAFVTR
jgi:hypothetical protein